MSSVRDVPMVLAKTDPSTGEVSEYQIIQVRFPDAVPLIQSLVEHKGKYAKALEECGLSLSTWRRYLAHDELGDVLRDIMSFYDELLADKAETLVGDAVEQGDLNTAKWVLERTRSAKFSPKQKIDTDIRVTVQVQEF